MDKSGPNWPIPQNKINFDPRKLYHPSETHFFPQSLQISGSQNSAKYHKISKKIYCIPISVAIFVQRKLKIWTLEQWRIIWIIANWIPELTVWICGKPSCTHTCICAHIFNYVDMYTCMWQPTTLGPWVGASGCSRGGGLTTSHFRAFCHMAPGKHGEIRQLLWDLWRVCFFFLGIELGSVRWNLAQLRIKARFRRIFFKGHLLPKYLLNLT